MFNVKRIASLALLASLSCVALAHAYAVADIVPAGAADAGSVITARVANIGGSAGSSTVYVGTKPPMVISGVLMTSAGSGELLQVANLPQASSLLVTTHLPAAHNCWVYVMTNINTAQQSTKAFWLP